MTRGCKKSPGREKATRGRKTLVAFLQKKTAALFKKQPKCGIIISHKTLIPTRILYHDSNKNSSRFSKKIEITDPIYTFNEVMEQIDLTKYYRASKSNLGRPKYNCEKMLKVALFAFMENGYASLRNIEKLCKTDIRYIWLLDGEKAPTYVTVSNCGLPAKMDTEKHQKTE